MTFRLRCWWTSGALVMGSAFLVGCGGEPTLYPVSGTVKMAGVPLDSAQVFFTSTNPSHNTANVATNFYRGVAVTDAFGQFEASSNIGKPGLAAGEYKVTVNRPLNKSGKALSRDDKDDDRPTGEPVESIPMPYCDNVNFMNSPLTITVPGGPFEFDIPAKLR